MENLRQAAEADLKDTLEGEWKMIVELTSPDGIVQTNSLNDPDELLGGQVLYFSKRLDPETGEIIVVNNAVVTLRISSLLRVPAAGETWHIKMPISPVEGADMKSYVFSPDRSTESGSDIGFIRIYPQRLEGESGPDVLS